MKRQLTHNLLIHEGILILIQIDNNKHVSSYYCPMYVFAKKKIISIGVDLKSSEECIKLSEKYEVLVLV